MTEYKYSDTSTLNDRQKQIVEKARAEYARLDSAPADQRSKLDPRKQDFPIGVRPDGTANLAEHGGDDDSRCED